MFHHLKRISKTIDNMRILRNERALIFVRQRLVSSDIRNFIDDFMDSSKSEITSDVLDIAEEIIVCAKTIYESDIYNDPYSDRYYDSFLSKFKKFRKEPFGDNAIGLANAKYKYDTLSGTLNKVHFITDNERDKFNKEHKITDERATLEEYLHTIPSNDISMLINYKQDGTSVTVDYKYEDGYYVPVSAISRGRKDYGEGTDVSAILRKKYKLKSRLKRNPKYIGIQYEMIITKSDKMIFENITGKTFSNCRSAISGLLRRIIFANDGERKVLKGLYTLIPVGFDVLDEYKDYLYSYDKMYSDICNTFTIGNIKSLPPIKIVRGSKSDILKYFKKYAAEVIKLRNNLENDIDGLVLTIINDSIRKKMGRKNNINQFQIAYKFPEESYKTIVRDLIVTTGNFGYKELLLQVDPVNLNGTIQSKAQLHSIDRYHKMSPRVGDEIILKLSGDVIPYGYKDKTCKSGNGPKLKLPKYCDCGSVLVEENNRLRCKSKDCKYNIAGLLRTFFVSLNAKGIGYSLCMQLYEELGITTPDEVLKLTKEDFLKLNGFKDASATAAYNTILDIRTKPRSPESIISSIGIDSLRAATAEKILEKITFNELLDMLERGDMGEIMDLLTIVRGIDKNANKIAKALLEKRELLKSIASNVTLNVTENKHYDKTIVVSGLRNDQELIEVANRNGYNVKDKGTKYDLLVIKNGEYMNTSKALHAIRNGIPIMLRDNFIEAYK